MLHWVLIIFMWCNHDPQTPALDGCAQNQEAMIMSNEMLSFMSIGWYIFGTGCGAFVGGLIFKDNVGDLKIAALPLILSGFIILIIQVPLWSPNTSAGWMRIKSGGSHDTRGRTGLLFYCRDYCSNGNGDTFIDGGIIIMIPPLKVKCSKNQYNQNGTCQYFQDIRQKHPCLKHNCIYFDGERKWNS